MHTVPFRYGKHRARDRIRFPRWECRGMAMADSPITPGSRRHDVLSALPIENSLSHDAITALTGIKRRHLSELLGDLLLAGYVKRVPINAGTKRYRWACTSEGKAALDAAAVTAC